MVPAPLPTLILASASPRRRDLLAQIGIPCRILNHRVDEAAQPGESPSALVQRLAREKALDVLSRTPAANAAVVLGADTVVVCDDQVLGKPRDGAEAMAMLAQLSDRVHRVYSAVTVCDHQRVADVLSVTEVRFRAITPVEAAAYWATGEPLDKAGGYAIQGLGAVFVAGLSGSFTGVVGLPLFETAALLRTFGVSCWQGLEAGGDEAQ